MPKIMLTHSILMWILEIFPFTVILIADGETETENKQLI